MKLRYTIRLRLAIGFSIIIALIATIYLASLYSSNQVNTSLGSASKALKDAQDAENKTKLADEEAQRAETRAMAARQSTSIAKNAITRIADAQTIHASRISALNEAMLNNRPIKPVIERPDAIKALLDTTSENTVLSDLNLLYPGLEQQIEQLKAAAKTEAETTGDKKEDQAAQKEANAKASVSPKTKVERIAELIIGMEKHNTEMNASFTGFKDSWQLSNEELYFALIGFSKSYENWNMQVINALIIKSALSGVTFDDEDYTPWADFRDGPFMRRYKSQINKSKRTIAADKKAGKTPDPSMVAQVERYTRFLGEFEKLRPNDLKLMNAIDELDSMTLESKPWDEVYTSYRDTIPIILKSAVVDINNLARAEQNIIQGQETVINTYREQGIPLLTLIDEDAQALYAILDEEVALGQRAMNQAETMTANAKSTLDEAKEVFSKAQQAQSEAAEQVRKDVSKMNIINIIIALLVVAVCILVGGWITFAVTNPMKRIIARLDDIAQGEGDLSKRVDWDHSDEFGELASAFNQFVNKIQDIIQHTIDASSEVKTSSDTIRNSSHMMIDGMSEQQNEVSQIGGSINELESATGEIARQSTDAASFAELAGTTASNGGQILEETLSRMNSISSSVNMTADKIRQLGEQGQQITQVVDLINDIAEQINLLALNAAIEAARAGEHGRGFAIVADEVRKLASRTTSATEQVLGPVKLIQEGTQEAIQHMESSVNEVQDSLLQAQMAGSSLSEIVDTVQELGLKIQSIATAVEQQSITVGEINSSVQSVGSIAEQTNAGADQTANALTNMDDHLSTLEGMLGRFKM